MLERIDSLSPFPQVLNSFPFLASVVPSEDVTRHKIDDL